MLNNFFTVGFGIVGASLILIFVFPLIVQLFISLGPIGFVAFLFFFFLIGSALTR
jgi:hypothetical protein